MSESDKWRAFSWMLRRKSEEAQKLVDAIGAAARHGNEIDAAAQAIAQASTIVYQEIAEMALTISKGQYR